MVNRIRITCIKKPHPDSPFEHITDVGGVGWTLSVPDVIKRIDTGFEQFFVNVGQTEVNVETVHPLGYRPYIKTLPDWTKKDNLLSLPPCPAR